MNRKVVKKMIATMAMSCLLMSNMVVDAQDIKNNETAYAEGSTETIPYGVYLQVGTSNINKVGTGKIYAKGRTVAEMDVSKISVGVRVERLVGNAWLQEDYFSSTKYNTYTVTASKTLTVPVGYFYRVKSVHTAHTDSSSSWTEGLYI